MNILCKINATTTGLPDTFTTRKLLIQHLTKVLNNKSSIVKTQKNGRVVRESLLMGLRGELKFESIWEGDDLITTTLFGGK